MLYSTTEKFCLLKLEPPNSTYAMTPVFPTIPSGDSIKNFFLSPSLPVTPVLKKKILSSKTKLKNKVRQGVLDLVFESSDITDTAIELQKLLKDAAVDIRPLIEAQIANHLFPKQRLLQPGDLVYYRPQEASVAITPPSQRSTSTPKNFVYKFDGVYVPSPDAASQEAVPTIMYAAARDIPDGSVFLFLAYGHSTDPACANMGATPVSKALDYLHSKATVLYDEKVYVVGFPKLPWTKFFIPDDILVKVDSSLENCEVASDIDDFLDHETTGGSSFLATLF